MEQSQGTVHPPAMITSTIATTATTTSDMKTATTTKATTKIMDVEWNGGLIDDEFEGRRLKSCMERVAVELYLSSGLSTFFFNFLYCLISLSSFFCPLDCLDNRI